MTQANFPNLPDVTLAAVNTVGQWLAQDDIGTNAPAQRIDRVVLAGNAVIPSIDAACRFAADHQVPLLISGGIGHSTAFLYAAIAHHPRYHRLATAGRAEASILADVAQQFWQIPQAQILIDDQSTNCVENARFSWDMMKRHSLQAEKVLVVQDPTMQRRTMATFARVCRDEPVSPLWIAHPGVLPLLENSDKGLAFSGGGDGLWPVDRYLSLVLGELPRLYDDVNGYGPAGRDFIEHVAFPGDVLAAWEILRRDAILTDALTSRSLI